MLAFSRWQPLEQESCVASGDSCLCVFHPHLQVLDIVHLLPRNLILSGLFLLTVWIIHNFTMLASGDSMKAFLFPTHYVKNLAVSQFFLSLVLYPKSHGISGICVFVVIYYPQPLQFRRLHKCRIVRLSGSLCVNFLQFVIFRFCQTKPLDIQVALLLVLQLAIDNICSLTYNSGVNTHCTV